MSAIMEREIFPAMHFEEFASLMHRAPWQFAKTMPHNPHWYTLKQKWADPVAFARAARYTVAAGSTEWFGNRQWLCAYLNGWKYWIYDSNQESTLINKATNLPKAPYDGIADGYDGMFSDLESLEENEHIIKWANPQGRTLDIGCGTGLLLDYRPDLTAFYTGIDPSAEMLKKFHVKHPNADTVQCGLEHFWVPGPRYDSAVGLFGGVSYAPPVSLERLKNYVVPGGRVFLMLFKEGIPVLTHERIGISARVYQHPKVPFEGTWTEWKRYMVFEGVA